MSGPAFVDHVIHGRVPTSPRSRSDVFNPATGEVTGRLALGGPAEVDMAVAAAAAAFPGWAATPPHVRARVLFRFRDLVERNIDHHMVVAEQRTLPPAEGTRLKTSTLRWPKGIRTGAEFIMPTLK
ncbi:aldehyde dehydrogenase family protein (plasmid) [Sphingobium sp. SJ10-10]|uniref:aldehyde dehydrogenase family protein n=1 Tax=Sphingobium sp. SJ10-10 TaxID=3114999 RepID=UPI002E18A27C|nr:aldehyde dehydrogenase family protein [Sphingobium sp. SJ10-10]